MAINLYCFYATIDRVIDGDSLVLNIDMGFHLWYKTSCRLIEINTPELNAKEADVRTEANKAKNLLMELLPVGMKVIVNSRRLDLYGRPLAEITTLSGTNINEKMKAAGYGIT